MRSSCLNKKIPRIFTIIFFTIVIGVPVGFLVAILCQGDSCILNIIAAVASVILVIFLMHILTRKK